MKNVKLDLSLAEVKMFDSICSVLLCVWSFGLGDPGNRGLTASTHGSFFFEKNINFTF